ncbi:hypothetical protein Hesp01_58870 [Herbidospora sp. NBRC 101105]|nr:hypothetical protein Hesp01_58870 [Herbidospora sp. NBRC 101105]
MVFGDDPGGPFRVRICRDFRHRGDEDLAEPLRRHALPDVHRQIHQARADLAVPVMAETVVVDHVLPGLIGLVIGGPAVVGRDRHQTRAGTGKISWSRSVARAWA